MESTTCLNCGEGFFNIEIIKFCHNCDQNPRYNSKTKGYRIDLTTAKIKNFNDDKKTNVEKCNSVIMHNNNEGCLVFKCVACDHMEKLNIIGRVY